MNKHGFSSVWASVFCLMTTLWAGSALAGSASDNAIRLNYHKYKVYRQEAELVDLGSRVAGKEAEKEAADHIAAEMRALGLEVEIQPFDTRSFQEKSPTQLEQLSPNPMIYEPGVDFSLMTNSGNGDISSLIQPVDLELPPNGTSTSGCDAEDFSDFMAGNIALMQRGTCTFQEKAQNAWAAGAAGAIIFNEGNAPDRLELLYGTLSETGINIPVLGAPFALGQELASLASSGEVMLRIMVDAYFESITSQNVIGTLEGETAETGIVYLGGHYDSVADGPGANDNASGVAAMLEAARVLSSKKHAVPATLKFIAFGAEEVGLVGSYKFVTANLNEISTMGLGMINLDMIGVGEILQIGNIGYPDGGGPELTAYAQEKATAMRMAWEPFEAMENSDHTYFEQAGVPAVFLTQSEDPNYHTAEDTIDKIQFDTLEKNGELATAIMLDWAKNQNSAAPAPAMLRKSADLKIKRVHVRHDNVYAVE